MAYKFMASLLGLLLLACSSIHAAYTNTKESNIHAENTLPLDNNMPASRVDELVKQSSREQNEMVSRKLLRGSVGRALTEPEKAKHGRLQTERSESDDSDLHVPDRDLASKTRAGIANDQHELLLSGSPASMRTPISATQVVNTGPGQHLSNLQITGKEGRLTSLKSLLSNLDHNLHKRISLQEVVKKQITSDTMANPDKHIPTSTVSLQVSQPFSDPHATSESPTPDDTTDITDMDYTPAQKKPPIHNKSAP